MLYRLTSRSGMRLLFRAGCELINGFLPWFHRRSPEKSEIVEIWMSKCVRVWACVVPNAYLVLLCLRMCHIQGQLTISVRSVCWVSSSREYIMAKELVCPWEDKLKQDVQAPCSFEGVPHHTSDSAEGRSTTIKGHSVYLNLPAPACQMFQSFSFISSHEPYFYFYGKFVTPHFASVRKKKSQLSFSWRAERLNLNIVWFDFGKHAEIEGFGWRGPQGSPVCPSACLYWWRHWYCKD